MEDESEWFAGYRVLRRLGSGSRATVFLGHSGHSGQTGQGELGVAVKVFEPHVTAESLDGEIDALSAVSSPHVVRMLDIAIAPGRPRCIVLQRLAGGSLAGLLARGPALTPGAAVTVLVSVARGLHALRAAGFEHTRPLPTTVLLDENGCPVLTGLGHAVPAGAGGTGAHLGLARLARTVFDHVEDPAAVAAAEELSRWLEQTADDGPGLAAIEDRLFELAEPQPVLPAVASGGRVPGAPVAEHEAVPVRVRVRVAGARQRPQGRRTSAHPAHPAHAARQDRAPWWLRGRAAAHALRHRVRDRKRPLVIGGAIGAVVLVLALTLLPVHSDSAGSAAPANVPGSTASASPSPTAKPPPRASAAQREAISADEPVAATMALLALRRSCLRAGSPTCLVEVDQQGSPMLDADRSLISSGNRDQTQPGQGYEGYDGYEASLIQQSGGSALIALAPPADAGSAATPKPASALVIGGETGWRLREVFED